MNRQEEIELFDRFLHNHLSEDESEKFNHKLALDSEFRKQYESYLKTVQFIKTIGLRDDLKSIMDKNSSGNNRNRIKKYLIPIAAAASVVLVLSFLFLNKPSNVSTSDLFQAYYKPYPNLLATRGSGNDLAVILDYYSKGEFKEALYALNNIHPETDTILLYRALCNISLHRADSAIPLLEQIHPGSIFTQQKNWYKGMSLLLMNDLPSAISSFKQIKEGEFKYNEAVEIINKIKSNSP